jgi:hypothetical protein
MITDGENQAGVSQKAHVHETSSKLRVRARECVCVCVFACARARHGTPQGYQAEHVQQSTSVVVHTLQQLLNPAERQSVAACTLRERAVG